MIHRSDAFGPRRGTIHRARRPCSATCSRLAAFAAPSFRAECPASLTLREAPGHAAEESLFDCQCASCERPTRRCFFCRGTTCCARRTYLARCLGLASHAWAPAVECGSLLPLSAARGLPRRAPRTNLGTPISRLAHLLLLVGAQQCARRRCLATCSPSASHRLCPLLLLSGRSRQLLVCYDPPTLRTP